MTMLDHCTRSDLPGARLAHWLDDLLKLMLTVGILVATTLALTGFVTYGD